MRVSPANSSRGGWCLKTGYPEPWSTSPPGLRGPTRRPGRGTVSQIGLAIDTHPQKTSDLKHHPGRGSPDLCVRAMVRQQSTNIAWGHRNRRNQVSWAITKGYRFVCGKFRRCQRWRNRISHRSACRPVDQGVAGEPSLGIERISAVKMVRDLTVHPLSEAAKKRDGVVGKLVNGRAERRR